jgi:ribosomal protein L11 methyltransferase
MSWIEIELNIPQEELEQVSGYLFALGCEGINVSSDHIIVYFNKHRWSHEIKLGIIESIGQIIPQFSSRDMRIKAISDQDWTQDWKKYFKPVKITTRIIVKPPWEEYRQQEGEHVITINPKMAFGTGQHESTKLVIMALEKRIKPGMHVLDVGTGSGILAIICEKLGAESVLGIDNDIHAIRNAVENAKLNKSSNKVRFILGYLEQFGPKEYDLIVANINRKILLDYSGLFVEFLKPNGIIIISGFLRSDEAKILDMYQKSGFTCLTKNAKKEWLSLILELKEKKVREEKPTYVNQHESNGVFPTDDY